MRHPHQKEDWRNLSNIFKRAVDPDGLGASASHPNQFDARRRIEPLTRSFASESSNRG